MAEKESVFTYFVTIIGILIVLLLPVPIIEEYRLFGIAVLIFAFVGIILSRFNRRLEEQELETMRLSEKLKIHEQLIGMKADIIGLQKRLR